MYKRFLIVGAIAWYEHLYHVLTNIVGNRQFGLSHLLNLSQVIESGRDCDVIVVARDVANSEHLQQLKANKRQAEIIVIDDDSSYYQIYAKYGATRMFRFDEAVLVIKGLADSKSEYISLSSMLPQWEADRKVEARFPQMSFATIGDQVTLLNQRLKLLSPEQRMEFLYIFLRHWEKLSANDQKSILGDDFRELLGGRFDVALAGGMFDLFIGPKLVVTSGGWGLGPIRCWYCIGDHIDESQWGLLCTLKGYLPEQIKEWAEAISEHTGLIVHPFHGEHEPLIRSMAKFSPGRT